MQVSNIISEYKFKRAYVEKDISRYVDSLTTIDRPFGRKFFQFFVFSINRLLLKIT